MAVFFGKLLVITFPSKTLKRFKASLLPGTGTHGFLLDGYQHEVQLHKAEPGKEDGVVRKGRPAGCCFTVL